MKNKFKIFLVIAVSILLIAGGYFVFRYVYIEGLVYSKVKLEAGANTPVVSDFVQESPFDAEIKTDLSQLDTAQLGDIEVVIHILCFDIPSTLEIYDDVPPTLKLRDVMADKGQSIALEDFVESVEDATVTSLEYQKKYDFSKAEDVEVTIVATDAADNATAQTAKLTIINDTTPPVISGVEDITVKRNSTVSYKKNVTVTDDYDENPTLEIDTSKVNLKVLGDYPVIYTATDAAGNTSEVLCSIIVESAELDNVTESMVNEKADEILASIITPEMTDEQKVKACFDWCYNNITYVETAYETNWVKAAYKGMVQRKGDCSANWGSMKCMLNRLGIKNMDIDKTYDGKHAHHKWNIVNLGDGWYHVDSMKNMWNVPIFMWTTDQLMQHSNAHNNTHGFDKSKYPKIQ